MTKSKLNIKYYGDSVLSVISSKIDIITDEIKKISSEMIEAMHKYDGIGLAAPQIGLSIKLIVVNLSIEHLQSNSTISPGEALLLPQMPITLVNPEVTSMGTEMSTMEEGCLSVPEVYAPVTRPLTITLKSQMLSGETINIECGGYLARVLLHEIDHLNGKLFIDRLKPEDYIEIKSKLCKLKKRLTKKGLIG